MAGGKKEISQTCKVGFSYLVNLEARSRREARKPCNKFLEEKLFGHVFNRQETSPSAQRHPGSSRPSERGVRSSGSGVPVVGLPPMVQTQKSSLNSGSEKVSCGCFPRRKQRPKQIRSFGCLMSAFKQKKGQTLAKKYERRRNEP